MKYRFKKMMVMLIAALLVLCACDAQNVPDVPQDQTAVDQRLTITVALGDPQDTLVPTYSTADGGETILLHLYENLMRWEDDGNGYATLVPGQAQSYTVETDYLGNATYTFTLRNDIVWSDGQPVTSYQFAAAWQRLADPAYASPHSELISCVAGYSDVQATGDATLLAVSTPDAHTLVVKLNGNVPYFLDVVCAGAYTMPIRTYLPGNQDAQFVTNGAYALAEFTSETVKLVKREDYYDSANISVDEIVFVPTTDSAADYEKLLGGEVAFSENLPDSVLQELASNENWIPEPVTATYMLIINTLQTPFDNADVRAAFRLAVDEQAVLNALGDFSHRPATGLVPYGVRDRGATGTDDEEQTEDTRLPDPNAPMQEKEETATYFDFRAHGEEIVTLDISVGYDLDCTWARTLLTGAGYAGGNGFPEVEYIYVDTRENRLVAECLRSAWQEVLGVTVNLRALTAEEYEQMLRPTVDETSGEEVAPAAFQIAASEITVAYNDAYAFLERWYSESAENVGRYSSAAFDILMRAADVAAAPESYDAYLHDAEAILMEEAPVIPVFYRGGTYALGENFEGLYRAPNGVYFFNHVTRNDAGNAE